MANDLHRNLMVDLMQRHQSLLALIGNSSVQYLDIPVHGNIGDLLIYLGTLEFLRNNGVQITAISSIHNYTPKRDGSIILLHGGGNFGDLYPAHQIFREAVISENMGCRIIVLPQSIHFESEENFSRTQRILKRHQDLHICTRDNHSLAIARQFSEKVLLLPDMAHQLYPIIPHSTLRYGATLSLLRTDKESYRESLAGSESGDTTDWSALVGWSWRRRIRLAIRLLKASRIMGFQSFTEPRFASWWEGGSKRMVRMAISLFSQYDNVVTDRLHAHILACLMGVRSIVSDNTYGKNSGYIRAWTKASPLTSFIGRDSLNENNPNFLL